MLAAIGAVAVTAFLITAWLLTIAGHAAPGTALTNARLDAVRTGLAAGAGAGAAVGLMLAFRRQHHQEIETVLTDLDATERRITEIYTNAVEQLGNDKAPVRLGGLYALERLAQDNPPHRQTIVNVICAYLRMPFSLTAPASTQAPEANKEQGGPGTEAEAEQIDIGDAWQQERQVRLTAQRILTEHLRHDEGSDQHSGNLFGTRSWPGLSLDLAGASLINFEMSGAAVVDALFNGAAFSGNAYFNGATFSGTVQFTGATFGRWAQFNGAIFNGDAWFDEATFSDTASFDKATFEGDASFYWAKFSSHFQVVSARFVDVTFSGNATFANACFTGSASFYGATFSGITHLSSTTFSTVDFDRATFGDHTWFGGATFTSDGGSWSFTQTRILAPGAGSSWPKGWRLAQDDSGGHTLVPVKDSHS
jgi:uncharacterized protein YjbI with pentapeptide repeats